MISSLVLLSASVLSTPVFISDVKASREAGHLRVDVRGDGGIDPDNARTLIDDGRLVIYLGGTRVRSDNRSWSLQDGTGEIRAHRHKSQTELVVPLTGNGCDGPVELSGSPSGITALVGCEGEVASPRPKHTLEMATKSSRKTSLQQEKLKALVELPSAPAERADAAPSKGAAGVTLTATTTASTTAADGAAATKKVSQPPAQATAALAPVVTAVVSPRRISPAAPAPVVTPSAIPAVPAVGPATATTATAADPSVATRTASDGSGSGSLRAVALPALFLCALAAGAYWLSRRRRGPQQRHIEILETTSLGPKRALICARIGDETVILSSSEAGITLLKGGQGGQDGQGVALAMRGAVPSASVERETSSGASSGAVGDHLAVGDHFIEIEQPLEEALADIPEPGNGRVGGTVRGGFRALEGGLAGLFGKRNAGIARNESADRFDDLLEDSIEDQELRRKLAAGMSARVR
jgi:hypothetical protein